MCIDKIDSEIWELNKCVKQSALLLFALNAKGYLFMSKYIFVHELYRFAILYSTAVYTVLKSGVYFISGVDNEFSVVLESVLTGHEGWVYGVHWHPAIQKGEHTYNVHELIKTNSFLHLHTS